MEESGPAASGKHLSSTGTGESYGIAIVSRNQLKNRKTSRNSSRQSEGNKIQQMTDTDEVVTVEQVPEAPNRIVGNIKKSETTSNLQISEDIEANRPIYAIDNVPGLYNKTATRSTDRKQLDCQSRKVIEISPEEYYHLMNLKDKDPVREAFVTNLTLELGAVHQKNVDLERSVAQLSTKLERLQAEKAQQEEAEAKIGKKLEADADDECDDVRCKANKERLHRDIKEARRKEAKLDHNTFTLLNRVDELKAERKDHRNQINKLRRTNDELTRSNEKLKLEDQAIRVQIAKLEFEKAALLDAMNDLRNQLNLRDHSQLWLFDSILHYSSESNLPNSLSLEEERWSAAPSSRIDSGLAARRGSLNQVPSAGSTQGSSGYGTSQISKEGTWEDPDAIPLTNSVGLGIGIQENLPHSAAISVQAEPWIQANVPPLSVQSGTFRHEKYNQRLQNDVLAKLTTCTTITNPRDTPYANSTPVSMASTGSLYSESPNPLQVHTSQNITPLRSNKKMPEDPPDPSAPLSPVTVLFKDSMSTNMNGMSSGIEKDDTPRLRRRPKTLAQPRPRCPDEALSVVANEIVDQDFISPLVDFSYPQGICAQDDMRYFPATVIPDSMSRKLNPRDPEMHDLWNPFVGFLCDKYSEIDLALMERQLSSDYDIQRKEEVEYKLFYNLVSFINQGTLRNYLRDVLEQLDYRTWPILRSSKFRAAFSERTRGSSSPKLEFKRFDEEIAPQQHQTGHAVENSRPRSVLSPRQRDKQNKSDQDSGVSYLSNHAGGQSPLKRPPKKSTNSNHTSPRTSLSSSSTSISLRQFARSSRNHDQTKAASPRQALNANRGHSTLLQQHLLESMTNPIVTMGEESESVDHIDATDISDDIYDLYHDEKLARLTNAPTIPLGIDPAQTEIDTSQQRNERSAPPRANVQLKHYGLKGPLGQVEARPIRHAQPTSHEKILVAEHTRSSDAEKGVVTTLLERTLPIRRSIAVYVEEQVGHARDLVRRLAYLRLAMLTFNITSPLNGSLLRTVQGAFGSLDLPNLLNSWIPSLSVSRIRAPGIPSFGATVYGALLLLNAFPFLFLPVLAYWFFEVSHDLVPAIQISLPGATWGSTTANMETMFAIPGEDSITSGVLTRYIFRGNGWTWYGTDVTKHSDSSSTSADHHLPKERGAQDLALEFNDKPRRLCPSSNAANEEMAGSTWTDRGMFAQTCEFSASSESERPDQSDSADMSDGANDTVPSPAMDSNANQIGYGEVTTIQQLELPQTQSTILSTSSRKSSFARSIQSLLWDLTPPDADDDYSRSSKKITHAFPASSRVFATETRTRTNTETRTITLEMAEDLITAPPPPFAEADTVQDESPDCERDALDADSAPEPMANDPDSLSSSSGSGIIDHHVVESVRSGSVLANDTALAQQGDGSTPAAPSTAAAAPKPPSHAHVSTPFMPRQATIGSQGDGAGGPAHLHALLTRRGHRDIRPGHIGWAPQLGWAVEGATYRVTTWVRGLDG